MYRVATLGGELRDLPFIDSSLRPLVAEVRQVNAFVSSLEQPSRDLSTDEGRASQRRRFEAGGEWASPPCERAEERVIEWGELRVPLRVIPPSRATQPTGIYLLLHGGAWFLGHRAMSDEHAARIADECGFVVVLPGYRLAPEHPYPAAIDDCEAAALWVLERGAREFGSRVALIGGPSAGAHLAAATLVRLRDRHDAARAFAAANLADGIYDLAGTPSQYEAPRPGCLMRPADVRAMVALFTNGRTGDALRDPGISPMYAPLHDLCPALFTTGQFDAFRDDSVLMALRWSLAGNRTDLALYPECHHGFMVQPTAMAEVAHTRITEFLVDAAGARRERTC
jgi:acetyl esterase/lipase